MLGGLKVSEEVKTIALGPIETVKRYKGYVINGYRFKTRNSQRHRPTQNSGVVVTSSTRSYASSRDMNPLEGDVDYYGVINDILEFDYFSKFKVVMFRCDWADVNTSRGVRKDSEFGTTLLNSSTLTPRMAFTLPKAFSS